MATKRRLRFAALLVVAAWVGFKAAWYYGTHAARTFVDVHRNSPRSPLEAERWWHDVR